MMNKILNQRTDLWNKVFLFLITTLSVFVILIPRTFFGFDLTDTFFALELQVLLERDGPVYWNYIFLTNYIGLLWIKLCPIDNLFWWCHLGGVLTISLTSGLSFLIADKLLDVSRKIICAAVIVATVMVSWANCSLLVNYYTVPTLIFTLLLYLVLFIRLDRWSLFFVIGLLSAAEIGSRWPTAVLFIIPFVYIVFRKLTDSDFSLTRLKEYFPAVLIYLAGLVIGILTVYGLMCHYNVFERNSSGVHRGFEYVF